MGSLYPEDKSGTPGLFSEPVPLSDGGQEIATEKAFTRLLCLERRRAERSRKQFLLMLLDTGVLLLKEPGRRAAFQDKISRAVLASTRETDITGWYEQGFMLGTILTEIPPANLPRAVKAVHAKVTQALLEVLQESEVRPIRMTFHLFPEDSHGQTSRRAAADLKPYPDLIERDVSKRLSHRLKRSIEGAYRWRSGISLWTVMGPAYYPILLT